MSEALIRAHIRVTGRVQGVGFRAFVISIAQPIGVKGWVRNVGWDMVEIIAEGSHEQLTRLIEAVRSGPRAARVDDCRVEEEPVTGEFTDFRMGSSR